MPIELIADNVDLETRMWRYIPLIGLISLLETSELLFTRADKFPDQLEGMKEDEEYNFDNHMGLDDKPGSPLSVEKTMAFRKQQILRDDRARRSFGVSCWHLSNSENAAFWESNDRQIAIVSSLPAMRAAVPDGLTLYAGKVEYGGQYQKPVTPLFIKRLDFEWEREFRLVTGDTLSTELPEVEEHIGVPVDLDELLSEVYINPKTPAWEASAIKAMIARYGLKAKITISTLYQPLAELQKK